MLPIFLPWVRKNITPTTAHFHNDTLTAGRLAEECLWEAQGENLSAAEVTDAVGGNDTGFRKLLVDAHSDAIGKMRLDFIERDRLVGAEGQRPVGAHLHPGPAIVIM